MKLASKGIALAALLLLALAGLGAQSVLTVAKVKTAPVLDASVDAIWKSATPLVVPVMGGENLPGGKTEVNLRAVTSGDTIYFLMQYADPTQSFQRSPFVKQADGSWKKLVDPNDKGGDNNTVYEDKMAMIWSINSPSFDKGGCMISCHVGEAGKPYGNKYLPFGETADIWHDKFVRGGSSIGQIDDQFLDYTAYDKDRSPEAGRKSDLKTGGGYADVKLIEGKPQFGLPAGAAPTYWLKDSEKVAFDDARYAVGAESPSVLVAPFTGDRGDISVSQKWENGQWTIEFSRKLVTGSATDVQFADLAKTYAFGLAIFDNAQVRHAFSGLLNLKFAK
jgi:hypothetical protein